MVGALLVTLSAGCAGPAKRIEIHSEPDGAEILALDGTLIGSTPATFSGDILDRISKDDRVLLLVQAPGYMPRQVIFDVHGEDVHKIILSKFDENYFQQRLLKDFHKNVNEMSRELLRIQGSVMVRKLDEAERALEEFQKTYPNIAASYALLGNIEMLRGRPEKARAYLLRGESMDPDDPAIKRALGIQVRPTVKSDAKADSKPVPKPVPKKPGEKR